MILSVSGPVVLIIGEILKNEVFKEVLKTALIVVVKKKL